MSLIFNSFGRALGQMGDSRFLKVIFLGAALALALLAALTWAFAQVIAMLAPDALTLPLIGAVSGLATLLSWGGFLAMMVLSVFLMIPAASAFSGLFLDEVADAVEGRHYAGLPSATGLGAYEGLKSGFNFLGLVVAVNAVALIFYVFAGPFAPLVFWAVNGLLLGREYFTLVAERRLGRDGARALRKRHRLTIWAAGALMAAPLSIPLVNLIIPVLGVATFTHIFHGLTVQSPQAPAP